MRLTRRVAKLEHAARSLPDPSEAAQRDAAWRLELAFDLAFTDPEASELEYALAMRSATEGTNDPEGYGYEDEWCRSLSTDWLWERFYGRIDELLKQRGLKDIEEWVPKTYGMPEKWEARQRAKRLDP